MADVKRDPDNSGEDLDLLEIFQNIKAKRRSVIIITLTFLFLGLIIAIGSSVEYEVRCRILPDASNEVRPNLGGLGSLAGLAGINMNDINSSAILRPELYPQMVTSTPFLLRILHSEIYFENVQQTLTPFNYFESFHRAGFILRFFDAGKTLSNKIRGFFDKSLTDDVDFKWSENNFIIQISKEDEAILSSIRNRINLDVDLKNGVISIVVEMPDPRAAAELAHICIIHLQEEIIKYKIKKAKENRDFIKDRFLEVEERFRKAQERLAIYNDRNRNLITETSRTEQRRLEEELSIAFEIFKNLSSQLEQAEIKLKEETPVFTVLEPPIVPNSKSKPKRMLIVALFTIFGFAFGIFFVFVTNSLIRKK